MSTEIDWLAHGRASPAEVAALERRHAILREAKPSAVISSAAASNVSRETLGDAGVWNPVQDATPRLSHYRAAADEPRNARERLERTIDAAAGNVPLPPAKPPVVELVGPVKHPAGALPARALAKWGER